MGAGYYSKRLMARDKDRDDYFYAKAAWVERFAWLPKTCSLTGRTLWLTKCIMGVAMYTGPDEPVFEFKWHDYKEHTVWLLKQ